MMRGNNTMVFDDEKRRKTMFIYILQQSAMFIFQRSQESQMNHKLTKELDDERREHNTMVFDDEKRRKTMMFIYILQQSAMFIFQRSQGIQNESGKSTSS